MVFSFLVLCDCINGELINVHVLQDEESESESEKEEEDEDDESEAETNGASGSSSKKKKTSSSESKMDEDESSSSSGSSSDDDDDDDDDDDEAPAESKIKWVDKAQMVPAAAAEKAAKEAAALAKRPRLLFPNEVEKHIELLWTEESEILSLIWYNRFSASFFQYVQHCSLRTILLKGFLGCRARYSATIQRSRLSPLLCENPRDPSATLPSCNPGKLYRTIKLFGSIFFFLFHLF